MLSNELKRQEHFRGEMKLPQGLVWGPPSPELLSPDLRELVVGSGLAPEQSGSITEHSYESLRQRVLDLFPGLFKGEFAASLRFVSLENKAIPTKNIFLVGPTQDGEAFVKVSGSFKARTALRREVLGAKICGDLGLAVPRVFSPLCASADGRMLAYAMEFLGPAYAQGFPNSIESRRMIEPWMGAVVAKELLRIFGKGGQEVSDVALLPIVEPHLESKEVFREEFLRRIQILRRPEPMQLADTCARDSRWPEIPGSLVLSRWLDEAQEFLAFLAEEPKAGRYFCIGDVGPQNIIFPHRHGDVEVYKRPVVFFDLEVAGIAPTRSLQALVDWGRFFHRTAPNLEVQCAFLEALVQEAPLETKGETAEFLKRLILARLVLTAHIAEGPRYNPEYPRMDRLAVLMESLGPAIGFLRSHLPSH